MRRPLLILFLLASVWICNAQKRAFSFQHYGPEEGLSNTNISSIRQDKNNILYLATENGVYTYDGYNFSKIKPKTALKSNFIRNIDFDEQGNLIIVNRQEGVYRYDRLHNQATELSQLNFKKPIDELESDSTYYYSLTDQICLSALRRSDNALIPDPLSKKDNSNQAFALYKTRAGQLYVGRSDGLYRLNDGHQEKVSLGKSFPVFSITESQAGDLYLGSKNAIYTVSGDRIITSVAVKPKRSNNLFGFNEANVSKMVVDKYGKIWFTIQPEDNLYMIENKVQYDAFEILGIDKVVINTIYKDNNDNIWIGTFNEGTFFIQNPNLQNTSFVADGKILPVTCGAFVNGQLAIGTYNGFFIYDHVSGNTQTVVKSDNIFTEKIYNVLQDGNTVFYNKDISSVNEFGQYLIGESYFRFIPISSRVFYLSDHHTAYVGDWSSTLLEVKNYTEKKWTVLDTIVSFPDYRTRINTLYEDKNRLLIGTSDGLTVFDRSTRSHTSFSGTNFNFGINDITSHQSKTYIAHENGITVLEDSSFIQQVGEHRLSAVKKIKFYNNRVWLATLDGLYICDESFHPLVIYNKSNGLLSNTINDILFNDNTCCICSDKGVTICRIEDLIKQVRLPAPVSISSVDINDQPVLYTGLLHLGADETDVNINFSSPLFSKPNHQYFRYKFDNGKWTNLENTQVHITSIIGGRHQVEIICSYDGINWSEPVLVKIDKQVPFKETGWFAIVIIVVSLLVIIVISWIIVKRIRINAARRIQEDRQVNLLKHQAMNSLMSPHFIFNSLTSIQNYINANDPLKASEFLAKFSRLIRMIIEKASQGEIPLHEELTRLSYYLDLEKERFKGKFDFHLHVDDTIDTTKVSIPNMIIQPYAENSIIHGILPTHEHGNLYIRFKKSGEHGLLIEIEDDGIGYNKARENVKVGHKSLGTKTIENILDLNTKLTGKKQHVQIVDKSDVGKGRGTIITISLQT